ncbi:hypothetical protein B0H12DRAFT_1214930 [Mycena haematopus]|nr:hypothetical protein B0H12DRAFT_1214930 [Mycena haematopus]
MEDPHSLVAAFIDSLPILTKDDVDVSDSCPICLVSFESLLADSEPKEGLGVTKLSCGPISHIFCRKDLSEWIRNLHGSCPTCRYEFLDIHPPGSDDESSDGGEYIPNPNEDDDDEEDAFIDTSDGFTDPGFEMELDSEDVWEPSDGEEMHIDAESEPSSEGDSMEDHGVAVEVDVSVMEGDDSESSDETQAEDPK